ncbi:MAG: DNA cytosine methyltransferase [Methylacidiphilales bacterium]|nr:DNA cytosine methyltransferase [Candidatus Methylacidiphilales bacterium]
MLNLASFVLLFKAISYLTKLMQVQENARTKRNKINLSGIPIIQKLPFSFASIGDVAVYEDEATGIRYVSTKDGEIKKKLKVISLFTGAGGFDIGLEKAGFETAVCIEVDPDCRATLKHNRPKWKIFENSTGRISGDIRTISTEEILEFSGLQNQEVTLICGGVPCQPFSNIGKKQGSNDLINGDLFLEFVRIVKGIKPKSFIFENVAGIAQNKHSDVVNYMTKQFAGIGYGLSWKILNAADYGVGQKRERFFLIGILGVDKPAFPLPTHFKDAESWITFANRLFPTTLYEPEYWVTMGDVLKSITPDMAKREDCRLMNISSVVKERMSYISPGQNFKVLPSSLRPNCWNTGKHQGHDTFGRGQLDKPAPTIRTAAYNPSKGKYIHPLENRGFNTIELATFQSFPSDWIFKSNGGKIVTLVSAGKQIGNAVPPLLAEAIGRAIQVQI